MLHVAVDGMNYSAVRGLISLEIGEKLINSVDNFNMTPMHIAAINFDIEVFNLLTGLKPDVTLKDSEGKTCLDYLNENEDISSDILKCVENLTIK